MPDFIGPGAWSKCPLSLRTHTMTWHGRQPIARRAAGPVDWTNVTGVEKADIACDHLFRSPQRSQPAKPAVRTGPHASEASRCRPPRAARFPRIPPIRHACREERISNAKGGLPGGRPTPARHDRASLRRSQIASTSCESKHMAPTRSHALAAGDAGIEARTAGSKIDRRSPDAGRQSSLYREFPIASRPSITSFARAEQAIITACACLTSLLVPAPLVALH